MLPENITSHKAFESKELFFSYSKSTKWSSRHDLVKDYLWRICEVLLFRTSIKFMKGWRNWLLRCFGAHIGKGCYVSNRAILVQPWNITLGDCVNIDDYVFIKASAEVRIGDHVQIANYVKIVPGGHDVRSNDFRFISKPITIGNGAFLGFGCFIGPGVKIGQMAVIGSNARIYKSVDENTIIVESTSTTQKARLPRDEYLSYRYNENK